MGTISPGGKAARADQMKYNGAIPAFFSMSSFLTFILLIAQSYIAEVASIKELKDYFLALLIR
jgi:hypothetical protein